MPGFTHTRFGRRRRKERTLEATLAWMTPKFKFLLFPFSMTERERRKAAGSIRQIIAKRQKKKEERMLQH